MKALIDADNVAIACAFAAADKSEQDAKDYASLMLDGILKDVNADSYELWLSGGDNFRYNVYPEYKANRKDQVRPEYEQVVKQHMVDHWQANYSEGLEADDMLGIRQTEDTIICHLDKDLNQIKGLHFNWELKRLGEIVREKRIYTTSAEEADYWFFYQLLVGDTVDNIKGVKGIGPKKAAGMLYGCETNMQRYEQVLSAYRGDEEELNINAECVYIWRKPNDNWRNILSAV